LACCTTDRSYSHINSVAASTNPTRVIKPVQLQLRWDHGDKLPIVSTLDVSYIICWLSWIADVRRL